MYRQVVKQNEIDFSLACNPRNFHSYEKLKGDLKGAYSRRINHQHRLVYQILEEEKIIKIISL
ncbi:MAG: Txe/YoeB family addiction module toxin [Clostridiaceae bacterium]|nr:Txe/YoeB family addiction module toxin [Clostridiaceae bacterium]